MLEFAFGILTMWALVSIVVWGPRAWEWFKWQVWFDLRYSAGYKKGLAHGRTISRRDDSE